MPDLVVIVPSRGRPDSAARVVEAWHETGAFDDGAQLVFAVDGDDPQADGYQTGPARRMLWFVTKWKPMVPKLNMAAEIFAPTAFAVGFAGDDHLPRTEGWAGRYVAALREMGTGIVYGDDLLQGRSLPTQMAMTANIFGALGYMVPPTIEHLYCDNFWLDLGTAAGCLQYMPDVVIEHVHPLAGKAAIDDGYRRVNSPRRYRDDSRAYKAYASSRLEADVAKVRALRGV